MLNFARVARAVAGVNNGTCTVEIWVSANALAIWVDSDSSVL